MTVSAGWGGARTPANPASEIVCSACKKSLPVDNFSTRGLDAQGRQRYSAMCRPCRAEYRRGPAGRKERAATQAARKRKYQTDAEYRATLLARRIEYVSGITAERYEEMLAAQGGGCAICATSSPGGRGRFHVDHDHECCPGKRSCGKCVRGLLCHSCNTAIGLMSDSPRRLVAAVRYLGRADV